MTQHQDGGPAFPRPGGELHDEQDGMSLLDWFAGTALAGEMAGSNDEWDGETDELAVYCYRVGKAMIRERNRILGEMLEEREE